MLSCLGRALSRTRVSVPRHTVAASRRMLSTEGTSPSAYRAKREPWITPTMVLVGLIPIFTFGLGTWQVQRLKWKVALIDELEEKLRREAMPLPPHVNTAAIPEFAFRKVALRGRWDASHLMLLGPRVWDGNNGYHVVVPLVRSDGSTVLVDRGFVAKDLAQNVKQRLADGGDEVEVLGMLRTAQVRNNFTPENHPDKGEWYWADIDAMAAHAGGEEAGVQPVFVEEIFEGHAGEASSRLARGVPIGRSPSVDVRNSHLSYIVTWYSLSAVTTAMFVRLVMKRRQALARIPR
ncbi:mitochondrial protein required for respiration [Lentinus tigrinus ALCF2SS1-7]|uniref:mitochondrial protein required for respiration n=1 Tax=Lentinus tigrinus ALCF2SS1-7 TaxID=1328758 RepID=UPI001165CA71|nr:mitochondrial protein required for respiration [Lentinus tigrinus ALCF2SS1-7]